jgi:hypothetical protein
MGYEIGAGRFGGKDSILDACPVQQSLNVIDARCLVARGIGSIEADEMLKYLIGVLINR